MKRLTSVFLVLVMLLTIAPMNIFAAEGDTPAFSDMKSTDYYAQAATALEEMGIIAGYPDGTYGAEKSINRAEMAAIVCRIIYKEADTETAKGRTIFDDVAEDYWASGYINVAVREKIINGDGDGKFRPEDDVTYEEAIKMIVCALGYGENVTPDPADWSKAYIDIADDKGITSGLKGKKGEAATRGDIAVMSYNGLSADLTMPTASLGAGIYRGKQTVKLETLTKDAEIYYTIDGSDPTVKSAKYTKAISISKSCTLKAIAVIGGAITSGVLSVDYRIKHSGGGGGSSTPTTYTVSFDLNYNGATGTPSSQTVNSGNKATEPELPIRDHFEFAGWYTNAECTDEYTFSTPVSENLTLYADWYSTLYGIHDLTLNESNSIITTLSAEDTCKLQIEILNHETYEVLYESISDVSSDLQNSEVSVEISNMQLPRYFLITAVLTDENGKKLCKKYTCIDHTPEYEEFMAKTVNDFDEEYVVNFDESGTNNFAVLNEDVERIDLADEVELLSEDDSNSKKNVLNETNSDIKNNYFEIENIGDELKDTQIGDVLYLEYGDGIIITVENFEIIGDDTLKVWGSVSGELRNYFDFIKVDMELDPDDYEEVNLPEYSEGDIALMAEVVDVDTTLRSLKFAIPIELSCKNQAGTRSGKFGASVSVEVKPKLVIKWDVHWGSKDYFEFKLSLATTAGVNASLEYSRTNGGSEEEIEYDEMLEKVASVPLGKVLIPFGVTGLGATVELTVPVSVEFKASANFKSTTTISTFVSYDSTNGGNTGKKVNNTKSFTVEGEVNVKVGPKLEESIEFLGDFLKASLVQSGGLYLDVKATFNIENTDHLCDFCATGEFGLFLTASAKLSYKISDNIKGTPVNLTFYDAKWKIIDCYFSSISGFGFGTCPNISTNWNGQCTLSGKITVADRDTDNNNNEPLEGARISLKKVDANQSASTATSASGTYTIDNVPAGEYVITISKDGYITIMQTISIVDSETNHYNAIIEAIAEEDNGVGKASGKIFDAVTGAGVKGLKLVIRKGLNNLVGDFEQSIISKDNGEYITDNLNAGNYTVQIIDERNLANKEERYYPSSFSIKVLGDCTIANQNGNVTNGLTIDQLRIVLRWGATPRDLDSHIVGPDSSGGRFHVYFSNKKHSEAGKKMVDLDLDDTSSYGPETTTVYVPVSGKYTFLVHDYSNKSYTSSTTLSNSGAYVEVYLGTSSNAAMTFYVPDGIGTLWTVFEYDSETGRIQPINRMSNQSSAGQVGLYRMDWDNRKEDEEIVFESVLNATK